MYLLILFATVLFIFVVFLELVFVGKLGAINDFIIDSLLHEGQLINFFLSIIFRKLSISSEGNSILADRPWLLTRTLEKPWFTIHSSAKAICSSLVELISSMAENLYPLIRQLLSSKESTTLNQERWYLFTKRLRSLIRERMNIQRSYVAYLLHEDNNEFFRELLVILSLSCGQGGVNRLKASLYHHSSIIHVHQF